MQSIESAVNEMAFNIAVVKAAQTAFTEYVDQKELDEWSTALAVVQGTLAKLK